MFSDQKLRDINSRKQSKKCWILDCKLSHDIMHFVIFISRNSDYKKWTIIKTRKHKTNKNQISTVKFWLQSVYECED